jgi:hypothetical protein
MKTAALGLLVVVSACAAHRNAAPAGPAGMVLQEKAPGLFVGHTDTGQVVLAATHYDAMNGLAVLDTDLGLEARREGSGAMMCRREVPLGSHLPHWACRYVDDIAHERQLTLNTLQQPFTSLGGGGSQGMSVTQGSGPTGHTQQR